MSAPLSIELPMRRFPFVTPVQVLMEPLFTFDFMTKAWWLDKHWVNLTELFVKYRTAAAALSVHATFPDRVDQSIFWADAMMRTTCALRQRKYLGWAESVLTVGGRQVCNLESTWRWLELQGHGNFSALPRKIDGELAERWPKQHLDDSTPPRYVPKLVKETESGGKLLAESTFPFFVHRQFCDFGDQWGWWKIAGVAAESREKLAGERIAQVPELELALAQPIHTYDQETSAPMFFMDEAVCETKLYKVEGGLTALHRLKADRPPHDIAATVVERFLA